MPKIAKLEEVWFDFPDDPLNGSILIRHLKEGEVQEIVDKNTKAITTLNPQTNIPETVLERKDVVKELAIESVKDWKNFFDGKATKNHKDGQPLKCSRNNIEMFCMEDGFLVFVTDCRAKLSEMVKEKIKGEEKNLKG